MQAKFWGFSRRVTSKPKWKGGKVKKGPACRGKPCSVLTEVFPKPTQTILKGSCSPKFLKYQSDTQFYSLCEGSSFKNIKQLLLKVSAL